MRRLLCIVLLCLAAGCGEGGGGALKARSLDELKERMLARDADLDLFRPRGPFAVTTKRDLAIELAPGQTVVADLFVSSSASRAPLVILMHGLDNSKEDHGYQGLHLASWGLHCLVVSLPKYGPWVRNGGTIARLASLIHANPAMVDERIDPGRIVLAGHSFGASAVAVAMAEQASPVAGGVLLDPAGAGRSMPGYLKRIRAPVMSLTSDENVTLTRNRGYFYRSIPRDVAVVSITNASHEDAQFPLKPAPKGEDKDSSPDEALQLTYVSALTAAALSIALTGGLDYAWDSFDPAVSAGRMFGESRKQP